MGMTCYEQDEIDCEDEMCLRVGCRLQNARLAKVMTGDAVDKATAWDAIAQKNAEIASLRAQLASARKALEEIADPLKLEVDGIGINRALKLISRMSSIAKDVLVDLPDAS